MFNAFHYGMNGNKISLTFSHRYFIKIWKNAVVREQNEYKWRPTQ